MRAKEKLEKSKSESKIKTAFTNIKDKIKSKHDDDERLKVVDDDKLIPAVESAKENKSDNFYAIDDMHAINAKKNIHNNINKTGVSTDTNIEHKAENHGVSEASVDKETDEAFKKFPEEAIKEKITELSRLNSNWAFKHNGQDNPAILDQIESLKSELSTD